MDMRKHIETQCELANAYAKDGAYHSAASILQDLADELKRHAVNVSVDLLKMVTK